jgi:hypothetical protein
MTWHSLFEEKLKVESEQGFPPQYQKVPKPKTPVLEKIVTSKFYFIFSFIISLIQALSILVVYCKSLLKLKLKSC